MGSYKTGGPTSPNKALKHPNMEYLQLMSGAELPNISKYDHFKCVLVVEQEVSKEWQAKVSKWLCEAGCRYMMAWGKNCSSWDDSVDLANVIQFEGKSIPDEAVVRTTWHEDESLKEVFWFAKYAAHHESLDLKETIILHVSSEDKHRLFASEYSNA